MGRKLELVETGPASGARRMKVAELGEVVAPASVDGIGLDHGMAQWMLGDIQRAVVALQEAVDYARRQRAGKPVGTSTSEGLANALVNRRMNKLQQMRWSAAGAHAVVTMRVDAMNAPSRGAAVATAPAA